MTKLDKTICTRFVRLEDKVHDKTICTNFVRLEDKVHTFCVFWSGFSYGCLNIYICIYLFFIFFLNSK